MKRLLFRKGLISCLGIFGLLSVTGFSEPVTMLPSSENHLISKEIKQSKIYKINRAIERSLTEDKGFAMETLDENTHSTEINRANPVFVWASSIKRIIYDRHNHISVYMVDNFKAYSIEEKNRVATSAQNVAIPEIIEQNKIKNNTYTKGIYTSIYCDGKVVGHSRWTNLKKYKWRN